MMWLTILKAGIKVSKSTRQRSSSASCLCSEQLKKTWTQFTQVLVLFVSRRLVVLSVLLSNL